MEREAGYLPAVLDDTSDMSLVALAVETIPESNSQHADPRRLGATEDLSLVCY
jgi:hypothetical protein